MVIINKVKINSELNILIGLNQIYGISYAKGRIICNVFGLNINIKLKQLSVFYISLINYYIMNKMITQSEKKKNEFLIIKHYLEIKNFKGLKIKLKKLNENK